jgi:hypothetical protein
LQGFTAMITRPGKRSGTLPCCLRSPVATAAASRECSFLVRSVLLRAAPAEETQALLLYPSFQAFGEVPQNQEPVRIQLFEPVGDLISCWAENFIFRKPSPDPLVVHHQQRCGDDPFHRNRLNDVFGDFRAPLGHPRLGFFCHVCCSLCHGANPNRNVARRSSPVAAAAICFLSLA